MAQSYENLLIDEPAEGVRRITLNRPERLKALTYGLVDDLHHALDDVDRDHGTRVVNDVVSSSRPRR